MITGGDGSAFIVTTIVLHHFVEGNHNLGLKYRALRVQCDCFVSVITSQQTHKLGIWDS